MDWIAGLFEILAKIIVGRKNKWGWALHLIAGGLWTYVSLTTELYGLLLITIPAVFINIYNFIKWYKEDKNESRAN